MRAKRVTVGDWIPSPTSDGVTAKEIEGVKMEKLTKRAKMSKMSKMSRVDVGIPLMVLHSMECLLPEDPGCTATWATRRFTGEEIDRWQRCRESKNSKVSEFEGGKDAEDGKDAGATPVGERVERRKLE